MNEQEKIARLAELGAATVYEAQGQRFALDPAIKPLDKNMTMAGRARTLRLEPADNWYIHVALVDAQPGDVLVVDAAGYTQAGPWGDVLTLAAQTKGLAGLVIDGAVRDSRTIIESGFPVFSRGTCIRRTTKVQKGDLNTDITVGGVVVHPGDILVGDADGLVVVRKDELDDSLAAAEAREAKEEWQRAQIRAGAHTLDLLGLPMP